MDNKYQRGKIYKIITSNSNDVYIGSTTYTLKRRLGGHVYAYKKQKGNGSSFIILRQGNYSIQLIKDFPCNSRRELVCEEGKYIQSMDCVNLLVAGRTKKEWGVEYYEKHKNNMKKKYHNCSEEKKEDRKLKYKKYCQDNEMKFKQKFVCECGGKFTYRGKWDHLKTKKHNKFIAIKNGNGVIELE